jgi:hypothetical protein
MSNIITINTSDLCQIIEDTTSPLNLKKKEVVSLRKSFLKKIIEKNPNAVTVASSYSSVRKKYTDKLRNAGFPGKGRPTTEMRAAAMSLMSEEDLNILELGLSKKWCKEAPAIFLRSAPKNIMSLRK